jgi:cytochrome P450
MFRDWESFSSRKGASIPDLSFGSTHIPVTIDPPEHHTFRKYLGPWFSLEAMRAREPEMRTAVRELVEGLAAKGEWDFVPDMADVMPGMVVLNILGMDPSRRVAFLAAMERGMKNQGTDDDALKQHMREDSAWIQEQLRLEIEQRRETKGEDMFSYLVHEPMPDGRVLTDAQIVDIVIVLLLAGFHTTSGALAAMLVHLQRNPDQRAYLQANRDKISRAIEEIIRVYSPATAMARTVTKDMDFAGVHLKKDDKILGFIMAANHDESKFPEAENVDFDRRDKGSIAFGWGVHRCLGIHMARVLLRIEVETLLDVIPDFVIDLDRVRLSDHMGIGYVHESVPAHLARGG